MDNKINDEIIKIYDEKNNENEVLYLFYLCLDRIISNTIIHFSAKYYNSREKVIQKINLISLEGNKAPIPKLKMIIQKILN